MTPAPENVARAIEGDTLDALVWRTRGLGPADLPAVLASNPGIAALGPILPKGTAVTLPATPAPATAVRDTINLWD